MVGLNYPQTAIMVLPIGLRQTVVESAVHTSTSLGNV
jgi:hypothetical protein